MTKLCRHDCDCVMLTVRCEVCCTEFASWVARPVLGRLEEKVQSPIWPTQPTLLHSIYLLWRKQHICFELEKADEVNQELIILSQWLSFNTKMWLLFRIAKYQEVAIRSVHWRGEGGFWGLKGAETTHSGKGRRYITRPQGHYSLHLPRPSVCPHAAQPHSVPILVL